MKLKNINAFEKHVDKAVIAVAVLFMLFVVWAYVVSDRFPAAQTIDDEVLSIAERLEERLNDPAPEELTGFQVPEYADQFVATINEPLTPVSPVKDIDANRLALPALAGFGVMIDDVQGPTGQPRYRPLDIQAPVELAVRSELVTLDPTQEQAVRGVRESREGPGDRERRNLVEANRLQVHLEVAGLDQVLAAGVDPGAGAGVALGDQQLLALVVHAGRHLLAGRALLSLVAAGEHAGRQPRPHSPGALYRRDRRAGRLHRRLPLARPARLALGSVPEFIGGRHVGPDAGACRLHPHPAGNRRVGVAPDRH